MATSQKFDALDGLEVTGQMAVGANLAVDTDTLYVDAVNDRVGINDSTPSYDLDVNGTARFTAGLYLGTNITHDGDADTTIGFTVNQIDLTAGNVNIARANTTVLSIPAGTGIAVRDVNDQANPSEFQNNSNKQNGAVAANFIYTSMIEAAGEKASGSTAIALGEIAYTGSGSWSNNAADQIKFVLGGADHYHFTTSSLDLESKNLIGVVDLAIANSIIHSGDNNTYFQFNTNDSARIVTNGTQRLAANTSGVFVNGPLDVSTTFNAQTVTVEDYFIETTVTQPGGTAVTINCNTGSVHEFTPSGNYSVDFTNVPTSGTSAFTLIINNNGTAREATWPGSGEVDAIYWAESVEPPSSAGFDIYNFIVVNGKIYGSLSIRNAGWAQ